MKALSKVALRRAGVIWILLLVALSLQPVRLRATAGGTSAHLLAHVLAFGLAAYVPLRLSLNRGQVAFRTLILLALGACIEISQSLLYHQRVEWTDFEADSLGTLISLLLLLRASRTGALLTED